MPAHGAAPNLFYRWKDSAAQRANAAIRGRCAAAAESQNRSRGCQVDRGYDELIVIAGGDAPMDIAELPAQGVLEFRM